MEIGGVRMSTTRISQRELESYLWSAAVVLRGLIDAGDYKEGYRKLNSKKYRPMAARKESRNVLSGRR